MSIVLVTGDGRDLKVNAWNWGVLHHFVARREILDDVVWGPKRYNGGGTLDAAQVGVLADFLEHVLLPLLGPGERVFLDGTVTDVPDDGTFYRAEDELWKNYSLHHDVLASVIVFLRAANGEVTFS